MENSSVLYASPTNTPRAIIIVDLIEMTVTLTEMREPENLRSTMTKSLNTPTNTSHTSLKQQTNPPRPTDFGTTQRKYDLQCRWRHKNE